MTPNTAIFDVDESASPRLFARVLQPTLVSSAAATPLRFPDTEGSSDTVPEVFHQASSLASPYKAPAADSSTTGALRVSPHPRADSHLVLHASQQSSYADHPIWDSEPAHPSHHYGAQNVPQPTVMFTVSARATASASLLLRMLRAMTVPLIIVCAALVALGSTQATMLPVLGMALASVAASAALALTERSRFNRLA